MLVRGSGGGRVSVRQGPALMDVLSADGYRLSVTIIICTPWTESPSSCRLMIVLDPRLAEVWAQPLRLDPHADVSFLRLGGDSVLSVRLSSTREQLALSDVRAETTRDELAGIVRSQAASTTPVRELPATVTPWRDPTPSSTEFDLLPTAPGLLCRAAGRLGGALRVCPPLPRPRVWTARMPATSSPTPWRGWQPTSPRCVPRRPPTDDCQDLKDLHPQPPSS